MVDDRMKHPGDQHTSPDAVIWTIPCMRLRSGSAPPLLVWCRSTFAFEGESWVGLATMQARASSA